MDADTTYRLTSANLIDLIGWLRSGDNSRVLAALSNLLPVEAVSVAPNSAGTAAVNRDMHWLPINEGTPRGCKLQLIDRASGVATYGVYNPSGHWTHWQGLPCFEKTGESG